MQVQDRVEQLDMNATMRAQTQIYAFNNTYPTKKMNIAVKSLGIFHY